MALDQFPTRPLRVGKVCHRLARKRHTVKRPFCSPAEGWTAYRLLPGENGAQCYIEVPHHFGVGPLNRGLVCGDYANLRCHPCDRMRQLQQSASPKDWELARRLRPVVRIFLHVLDLKRLEQGVQVLGVSQALFIEILNALEDVTLDDVIHPTKGRNIRIRKVVEDTIIRYPEVQMSPRSIPIPYMPWRSELVPLKDYFVVLPYRQQQLVFAGRLDPQAVTGFTYAS
jgi:hypothetical protein